MNKLVWMDGNPIKVMIPGKNISTHATQFASVSSERGGVYYRVVIHHEAETWQCSAAFDARTLDEARHRVEQIYENVTRRSPT